MLRRARCERTHPPPPPGSHIANDLQIELRFSYFLSAGSQWHLRDHHRWPICLHFALELLNTVREPLCGWHRAAHRHRVGGNGIFAVIGTQLQTSFLVLSRSLSYSSSRSLFLSKVPAMGSPMIKPPFVFNLPASNPSACQSRATRTDRVHSLLSPPLHSCCLRVS